MHWRHIKWRAPWKKGHLSVLEQFRAEDAAKEKAAAMEKRREETARRVTLERLENRESAWNRCKRSIRYLKNKPWRDIDTGDVGDESMMSGGGEGVDVVEEEIEDTGEGQESEIACEPWEGDYTSVLIEYDIN